MIELDFFKSKLLGHLKEYAPEKLSEVELIDNLSDAAYDEMNKLIKSGMTRYEAQEIATSQMLSYISIKGEENDGI